MQIKRCTDPRPSLGEETTVLRPVVTVDVEHTRSHDEHPHGEVDGVQDVVEDERLLHARRQQHHHTQGDHERQKVRWSTCNTQQHPHYSFNFRNVHLQCLFMNGAHQ